MIRVLYFPMETETLTPVTTENIDKRGGVCTISSGEVVSRIRNLIAGATPDTSGDRGFTDRAVRIKLVEVAQGRAELVLAVVEDDGAIRGPGGDGHLSGQALDELRRLVEAACNW